MRQLVFAGALLMLLVACAAPAPEAQQPGASSPVSIAVFAEPT